MVNPIIVNMLIRKIRDRDINPKTNLPFVIGDILIQEYKDTVQHKLI